MHLAVHGAIGYFLYIKGDLTEARTGTKSYLSKDFHQEILYWQRLCKDSLAWPRFLAEVVQRLPTALGFYDASGTGAGGVWIEPDGTGGGFVWRLQWPEYIVSDLVT